MKRKLFRNIFLFSLVTILLISTGEPTLSREAGAPLTRYSDPAWAQALEPEAVKAFPGAMGYGTQTPGGRGGRVIYVENLNDSGPGSLRAAVQAEGPRVVLFLVGGTIRLKKDIKVNSPYLTIAGQTAPGEGIQIRDAQIKIQTHDVVIRYLKIRSGDVRNSSNSSDRDAMTANSNTGVYNIVIDHCTLIWGPDVGGMTFLNGARDSTISYSITGEGLNVSSHRRSGKPKGHSMGLNITEISPHDAHPTRITVHHNLITNSSSRNPRVIGGELIDIVNNVIYNWKLYPSSGNPRSLNLINNYYIAGPNTTNENAWLAWQPLNEAGGVLRENTVFESGNLTEGFSTVRGEPESVYTLERFEPYSIDLEDNPETAYKKIVAGVGASLQVSGADGSFHSIRDSIDQAIIDNLVNRTGTLVNGVDYDGFRGYPAIRWPALKPGTPALDADLDGMPDAWEMSWFSHTKRGSDSDSSTDYDGDGYTDLEEYLNSTDPTR